MSEKSGLYQNTHPQFPGGVGSKAQHGKQARYSFIGADGKRHWHPEVSNLGAQVESSLRGMKLRAVQP